MAHVYSTYEAKARFSELLAKVRAGQRVIISYHGQEVAELRPLKPAQGFAERLEALEARGAVVPAAAPTAPLAPLRRVEGALQRFLEDRD